MGIKLVGDKVENPSDNNFGNATLVYILADANTEVLHELADGSTLVGRIKIPSGQSIKLVKGSTDVITCPTSTCTPIAYHW